MKQIYAFGKPVPTEVINELLEDYNEEEITTDLVERIYEYEYRDNEDNLGV